MTQGVNINPPLPLMHAAHLLRIKWNSIRFACWGMFCHL